MSVACGAAHHRKVAMETLDHRHRTNVDGSVECWDVDPDWWPEGLWMRVCPGCHRGPIDDGDVYCDEHDEGPDSVVAGVDSTGGSGVDCLHTARQELWE